MSISLNDHEIRIKSLESKSFGGYRAVYPNGVMTLNVGGLIDQGYNVFFIMTNIGTSACSFISSPILVPEIQQVYSISHHYEYEHKTGGCGFKLLNSNIYVEPYNASTVGITVLIALKLYYNFSYNIYCLICTFLEFLFKEV